MSCVVNYWARGIVGAAIAYELSLVPGLKLQLIDYNHQRIGRDRSRQVGAELSVTKLKAADAAG